MHTDLSIAVDKLTTEQMHEVNKCALHYGLGKQDFMSLLTRDLDEQEFEVMKMHTMTIADPSLRSTPTMSS